MRVVVEEGGTEHARLTRLKLVTDVDPMLKPHYTTPLLLQLRNRADPALSSPNQHTMYRMDTEPEGELSTAWSESNKQDTHRLSFLDLPRELRDLICSYTFNVTGAIFIYTKNPYQPERILRAKIVRHQDRGPSEPQSLYRHISTGLLQTCRQLHAESAPALYSANTFHIWLLSKTNLAGAYRQLLRHVTFTTEAAHWIFNPRDLDAVSHGWKHRFWPSILDSSTKTLAQFPRLETLTVLLKPGVVAPTWRPAFFAVGGKTAARRVELAALWLRDRCPLAHGRVRDCLRLELVAPLGRISEEEYRGSRFVPDEEEWDFEEFAVAFGIMKALG